MISPSFSLGDDVCSPLFGFINQARVTNDGNKAFPVVAIIDDHNWCWKLLSSYRNTICLMHQQRQQQRTQCFLTGLEDGATGSIKRRFSGEVFGFGSSFCSLLSLQVFLLSKQTNQMECVDVSGSFSFFDEGEGKFLDECLFLCVKCYCCIPMMMIGFVVGGGVLRVAKNDDAWEEGLLHATLITFSPSKHNPFLSKKKISGTTSSAAGQEEKNEEKSKNTVIHNLKKRKWQTWMFDNDFMMMWMTREKDKSWNEESTEWYKMIQCHQHLLYFPSYTFSCQASLLTTIVSTLYFNIYLRSKNLCFFQVIEPSSHYPWNDEKDVD